MKIVQVCFLLIRFVFYLVEIKEANDVNNNSSGTTKAFPEEKNLHALLAGTAGFTCFDG